MYGINVAPEFGTLQTQCILDFWELENRFFREGYLKAIDLSDIRSVMMRILHKEKPHLKWRRCERDDLVYSKDLLTSGHYTFDRPAFRDAMQTLTDNIERFHPAKIPVVVARRMKELMNGYARVVSGG